jgi:hypothetical protein
MKLLTRSLVAAAALLTMATPVWAKKEPVDLSEFRGAYTGTLSLTISNQATYFGTATVVAAVPKSGRSIVLTTTGVLNANQPLPFSTTFTFGRNGTYLTPSLLLGLEGAGIAETGTYKVRKRALIYNATFASGGTSGITSGKLSVRTRGRKQTLTFTNFLSVPGQTITTTFTVTRKIKKQ